MFNLVSLNVEDISLINYFISNPVCHVYDSNDYSNELGNYDGQAIVSLLPVYFHIKQLLQ